jgi:ketosteroid isomerase-like protein
MISSRLAPPFLLLFALACSAPRSGRARKEEIVEIARAQQSAWNRGDVEGYMRAGYLATPELVFFSGGDVTRGFEPVLARYLSRYKSEGTEMGKLDFGDLEALPLGDGHAMLRGRWKLGFESREDVGGLFTLVLRRTDAGWRIVHDHTSVAAPR